MIVQGWFMTQPLAVAFDCDGVLADNGSSWQAIHDGFGTENKQMLAKFIAQEIDDDEFMADDVAKWMEAKGRIHKDDIARCYGGLGLCREHERLLAASKKEALW